MLKMCLNWKVVAGLAAIGLAIWAVAPGFVAAALPILVLAACPLSMLAMGVAMAKGHGTAERQQAPAGASETPALRQELEAVRAREAALAARIRALEGAGPSHAAPDGHGQPEAQQEPLRPAIAPSHEPRGALPTPGGGPPT